MTISKLPRSRKEQLLELHWTQATDSVTGSPLGGHLISGQTCYWWDGPIHGLEQSAWIADSGDVYLHRGGDYTFEAFIAMLTEKPKPAPAVRGLFDLTEEDDEA